MPIAAAVERLGGIQQLVSALSKYPGFKDLSASTISRWSKLREDELPPRALQAADIIRRLSPNQSISNGYRQRAMVSRTDAPGTIRLRGGK